MLNENFMYNHFFFLGGMGAKIGGFFFSFSFSFINLWGLWLAFYYHYHCYYYSYYSTNYFYLFFFSFFHFSFFIFFSFLLTFLLVSIAASVGHLFCSFGLRVLLSSSRCQSNLGEREGEEGGGC